MSAEVESSGAVVIRVTDTGNDIPKGSGLGLTICRKIVTHYGGHIWAESELGKGSTFFFRLPARCRADA